MDLISLPSGPDASLVSLFAIVCDVAADAAKQVDPDICLRRLRAGLIRLGFSRAGIGIAIPGDPTTWHGTWGTDWDGAEIDEHRSIWRIDTVPGYAEVLNGEEMSLYRVDVPEDPSATVLQVQSATPGPPNQATVALRADGRLLGAISVDMLPGDGTIDPNQIAALKLLADITAVAIARAQVVDELRESETRYRILAELASDYNWVTLVQADGSGEVEWGSESLFRTTGFSRDELRDMGTLAQHAHPEDRARLVASSRKVIDGSSDTLEFRIITRVGEQRWLRLSRRPIWNDQENRVVRIIAAAQDITERQNLEEQLRQAQKMEAVGQLAGGIAHDFNNLLTVMTGYGEILAQDIPPGTPQANLVEQILLAGHNATSLTRQLLAFSRRQVISPRELDLNEVIDRLGLMLRRVIGEDVILHTRLATGIGKVIADPGQIEQILMNLATNARDAMPRGGDLTLGTANVDLRAVRREHPTLLPGSYVALSVSDTGTGIQDETKAHIFEPFFTTKTLGRGTGLGLAVVHGIVTQNNGSIEVSSVLGQGTTFTVYLPRVAAIEVVKSPQLAASDPPLGSETILLVEDSSQLRLLARLMLESLGYRVVEAESGAQALALSEDEQQCVDLLLTDVVMPNMSGRELIEILTARRPKLKVLMMSGYTDDMVVRHGVVDDDFHFLQKPFTRLTLAQKVRGTLNGK